MHNLSYGVPRPQCAIASDVSRKRNQIVLGSGFRNVAISHFNSGMDYAILRASDAIPDLVAIPVADGACLIGDVDLKVFHCPVGICLDTSGDTSLPVHSAWAKAAKPSGHHTVFSWVYLGLLL